MEESIDHRPSKRFKITREQNRCSTFECLSGELILELFEYFNTKEIFQSFFNLSPFITSCIFDQRRRLHLYFDRQMPSFLGGYFPNQIISLQIEHIAIRITIFSNLKSLSIVHGNEREEECLNMVKQVR
ncbi:unnamed protein product [Rotaria sordida]|uniref:Uncharacterized protein n=1 Tax=Rotaria sordida TaxID=392033 RepID=A0A816CCY0_9BILA|nr:unnamed protein product [Rotaria sordida]CAF1620643.1 unnamed protein product [Rotaria sordida]